MTMDHVPRLNNHTGDEALKSVYKALPASHKKGASENVPHSGAQLSSAVASVDISELSQRIGEIHRKLETIEDATKRRQAFEGLDAIASHLAGKEDASHLEGFLETMDDFEKRDESAFRDTFTTAGALAEQGHDVGRWVDAFNKLEDPAEKEVFVEGTRSFLESGKKTAELESGMLNRFIGDIDGPGEGRDGEEGPAD